MKELIRKQTLLTDAFGVSVDVQVDNGFSVVEINEIHEVSDNDFKEEVGVTLTLDYEEIDELIEVLKYASNQLKRGDNELVK